MNEHFYNIRIRFKERFDPIEIRSMLTLDYLENVIVTPYRNGEHIILDGRIIALNDIWSINIRKINEPSTNRTFWKRLWDPSPHEVSTYTFDSVGIDVTKQFIQGSPGSILLKMAVATNRPVPPADAREVFVVHGRNSAARNALFDFLRAIDLHPVEWSEATQATGKGAPYVGEILESISHAQAVVVLFTADDEARLKLPLLADDDPPGESQLTGQPRPNVFFEAGMAMAEKQDRTILVRLGSPHLFSDIDGRHVIKLDGSSTSRHELAQRLETAGCPVTKSGQDWLRVGDFDAAITLFEDKLSGAAAPKNQEMPIEGEELQLPEDAMDLLIEAVNDHSGTITIFGTVEGTTVQTNDKEFGEKGNARSEARWQQVVDILLTQGLIEDRAGKRELFFVTHSGYEIADKLRPHPSPSPPTTP